MYTSLINLHSEISQKKTIVLFLIISVQVITQARKIIPQMKEKG